MSPEVRVITFVRGSEFEELADLTIPRAEKVLGLPVERICPPADEDIFLARLKFMLTVEDDRPVLHIDSDMVFRSWDWSPFAFNRFNGVRDYPLAGWAGGNLRKHLGLEAADAINGGLWMTTRMFSNVFEKAVEVCEELMRQDYFLRLGDETALNKALQHFSIPINYLPASYNFQVSPVTRHSEVPPDTRVVHLVGNSVGPGETYDPSKKLERVKEALNAFALD